MFSLLLLLFGGVYHNNWYQSNGEEDDHNGVRCGEIHREEKLFVVEDVSNGVACEGGHSQSSAWC